MYMFSHKDLITRSYNFIWRKFLTRNCILYIGTGN